MKKYLKKKIKISVAFLLMFFLMILISGTKTIAQEELLKPIISFTSDLEYTGDQQILGSIQGEALDPQKTTITYEGVLGDGRPYQKTDQAPRSMGAYNVTVTYAGDENYQKISERQQVRIKPRLLKIGEFFTPSPLGKVYDGTVASPLVVIEDLNHRQILEADKNAVSIAFQSSRYLFKDVNVANKLVLSGVNLAGEKSYNYSIEQRSSAENEVINENREPQDKIKITDVLIDANIEKRPLGIYLTSGHKSYDGTPNLNEHGFAINESDLVKGERVEIQTDSNFSPWYGLENSKIKDVGSYLVYAQDGFSIRGLNESSGDNYRPANLPIYSHIKYQITPVEIIVSPAYRYKHEGEADPLLTYSVWQVTSRDQLLDGLFKEDTLFGALGREPGEAPGLYDINQGDLNNANYIILFENGENKFEIIEKETKAAMTIEGDDYFSANSGRGRWDEIITPEALFGGGLILLVIVVGGAFYVRNKMANFD